MVYLLSFSYAQLISAASLGRGTLALDTHETLSGILEAKSLSEMKDAIPQITAQVLTILVLT